MFIALVTCALTRTTNSMSTVKIFSLILAWALTQQGTGRALYLQLLPRAVDDVVSSGHYSAASTGPLILDASSFTHVLGTNKKDDLLQHDIDTTIKRPHVFRLASEALVASAETDSSATPDKRILQDGMFLELDSLRISDSRAIFYIRTMVTDQRPSGHSAICTSIFRVTFLRTRGEWDSKTLRLLTC